MNRPTPHAPVDVRALIDSRPIGGAQILTFLLCFLVVLLDGFDTAAIGYIAPSLVTEWGVSRAALAPVLSAALFGLAMGALSAGPLADRYGRKAVLVAAVAEIGVACLASSQAADLVQLSALRFLTGLGLGAAMPNAVTLTSEYGPAPRRSLLTNMMFSGFPLGAALGGFLAAWMIPAFGWRSVLLLGGGAPLALAVVLALRLPESVGYLVSRGVAPARIHAVLRRIVPGIAPAGGYTFGAAVAGARQGGLRLVLSPTYRLGSVMLWAAYFCGLVIFYALVNWMPILFREAGLDPRTAALIAALFPLGGIGAILLGALMDRFDADWMVAAGFALTAVAVAAIGQVIGQVNGAVALLVPVVLIAGTMMNTAQSSLPALAASFYPTEGRATGVAWMMGIGRFGGIAGSFLVAELAGLSMSATFAVVALPAILAAGAVLAKRLGRRAAIPARTEGLSPLGQGAARTTQAEIERRF